MKKKNYLNVDLPENNDLFEKSEENTSAEEFAEKVARNAKKLLELDKVADKEIRANAEIKEQPVEEQIVAENLDTQVTIGTNAVAAVEEEDKLEETYHEMSPAQLVARRFFRSKLSIVGLVMIVFLFLFSFLGPVIYNKWGEDEVDRTPTNQYIATDKTYIDDNGEEIAVTEVIVIVKDNLYADPSADHFLGTDDQGFDVFTRLMYGGRISLTIGFIVVFLETLIGIILGGLAGYFGGWVDQIIMRIVDIFNCIPTLPILLIAAAVIRSWELDADTQIYVLMAMITLFSWSGTARLVRGQILSLREQEYITATEVMGLPTWRKIFVHLMSNVMPQLIVSMTLGLGSVILYESTLSYLGLGVQLPKAAWGTMIATANDRTVLSYHVNMWLPAGFMIVIAVLGFNFIGDGLRDAMDPKAKK